MAVSGYFDAVQKIYIAFYQRPADPAGLRYWAERLEAADGDATAIINAFANSAEAQHLYGPINDKTIGDVIGSIYQALFGRSPDAEGKAYYEAEFANGKLTAGNIALAILNASKNDDQAVIANKLIVANKFTEKVDGRALDNPEFGKGDDFAYEYTEEGKAEAVRKALAAVTADPKTILNDIGVQDVLDDKAPAPVAGGSAPVNKHYILTPGEDDLPGTSANNKFMAALKWNAATSEWQQTLNTGDILNGGDGNKDVLEAELLGDTAAPDLASIEVVKLSGQGVLDLENADGIQHVEVKGMGSELFESNTFQLMDAGDAPGIHLDIGRTGLQLVNLVTPINSLTITDALGIVTLHHDIDAENWKGPAEELSLNLRGAIAVVGIVGSEHQETDTLSANIVEVPPMEVAYNKFVIDSGFAESKTHGNYIAFAGPSPAAIEVKGAANFGFITGAFPGSDSNMPAVVDASEFTGNLAAILVGEGSSVVSGGQCDDLVAFIEPQSDVNYNLLGIPEPETIEVDAGAGNDVMVFLADKEIEAYGGEGSDHFVFLQGQAAASWGTNAYVNGDGKATDLGRSADADDDVDTLWLDLHSGQGRTLDLFGEELMDASPNIEGIERVVHFSSAEVTDNIRADMARAEGAQLELAADYNGYNVTVSNIGSHDKADVVLSGSDVGMLSLEGKDQIDSITLEIRSVENAGLQDFLGSLSEKLQEDGNALDLLSTIHSEDMYSAVLESLKRTDSFVSIDKLKVDQATETLNLNLDESGKVDIDNVSGVHANVKITGGANLDFGSSFQTAYRGKEINAEDATGNLEIYLGLGNKTVLAGQGQNKIHVHQSELALIELQEEKTVDTIIFQGSANTPEQTMDGFEGLITKFEVGTDKVGFETSARDINPEYADGICVTQGSRVNVLEVKHGESAEAAQGTLSGGENIGTNFLKFAALNSGIGENYSFEDLFKLAIGGGEISNLESDANLLAVMYDQTNEKAVIFEVNSGVDEVIDIHDSANIEIVTVIEMSQIDYANFGMSEIVWF